MGCEVERDGPLGGRYFVANAAPMGMSTSPWVAQSFAWVLSKRWRRLGLKHLWYTDDIHWWGKPSEAPDVAEFIEEDLERHGMLISTAKSQNKAVRHSVCLGVEIDLVKMRFKVPAEKIGKVCEMIRSLLAAQTEGNACE